MKPLSSLCSFIQIYMAVLSFSMTGTSGGLSEKEYDAIVIGALFTPLVLAVFGILIIAAIVR